MTLLSFSALWTQGGYAGDFSVFELPLTKLRVRTFHEFMSMVPGKDGAALEPAGVLGQIWADYEIAPHYRILYYQKHGMDFGTDPLGHAQFRLRDPRFGLRRTQVFEIEGLTTNYDLYVQPGLTSDSIQLGRQAGTGFRTNSSYLIPASRWSVGVITDTLYNFYRNTTSTGSDFSGFVNPWLSYSLSSMFSTQHWVYVPFRHQQQDRWDHWQWNFPNGPYIQNGIELDVASRMQVSLLINNYLLISPSLANTWVSVWLSWTFL